MTNHLFFLIKIDTNVVKIPIPFLSPKTEGPKTRFSQALANKALFKKTVYLPARKMSPLTWSR